MKWPKDYYYYLAVYFEGTPREAQPDLKFPSYDTADKKLIKRRSRTRGLNSLKKFSNKIIQKNSNIQFMGIFDSNTKELVSEWTAEQPYFKARKKVKKKIENHYYLSCYFQGNYSKIPDININSIDGDSKDISKNRKVGMEYLKNQCTNLATQYPRMMMMGIYDSKTKKRLLQWYEHTPYLHQPSTGENLLKAYVVYHNVKKKPSVFEGEYMYEDAPYPGDNDMEKMANAIIRMHQNSEYIFGKYQKFYIYLQLPYKSKGQRDPLIVYITAAGYLHLKPAAPKQLSELLQPYMDAIAEEVTF